MRSRNQEALRTLGDEELAAAAGGTEIRKDEPIPCPAPGGAGPSAPSFPGLDIWGEVISRLPHQPPPVIYY